MGRQCRSVRILTWVRTMSEQWATGTPYSWRLMTTMTWNTGWSSEVRPSNVLAETRRGKEKTKNIKRINETHFAFTLIFAGYEMISKVLFTLSYNECDGATCCVRVFNYNIISVLLLFTTTISLLMAHFHCRRRTGIRIQTQIPVLYRSRVGIQVWVFAMCTCSAQCNETIGFGI